MNVISLKIGQYEVVTEDGKTAGDVLTYTSELVGTDNEQAKDLAEEVNQQRTIVSGVVSPSSNILYKAEDIPVEYALLQNYPNPFNASTSIRFDLPESGELRLSVFDLLGREVARLVDGQMPQGRHEVAWNAEGYPSGVYLYRIDTDGFRETRPMVLLK